MRDDRSRRQFFLFDAARAIAAFAVVAAHARTMIFEDAPRQAALGWFGQGFFAATGLGHQAVIVFFVISGTLVTRSMLNMDAEGQWSWARFGVNRLTRLWVVLLPCLLLGAIEDRLGLMSADPAGFYGAPGMPAAPVLLHLDAPHFVGSLVFLQGQFVAAFGSNAPLWTLSMEAWCYALGFALFSLKRKAGWLNAAALVALATGAGFLFGWTFWQLFPIWLLGSALALGLSRTRAPVPAGRWSAWAGVALIALALVGTRVLPPRFEMVGAYALALATAVALVQARSWAPASHALRRSIPFAAALSYSLYLSHFPVLALFWQRCSGRPGSPSAPAGSSCG